MSKKNLDNIFHEKFKDFSEVPDEKVWEGIATALGKKEKRRRVIPFWWKLGGVAAVLAITFYAIDPFTENVGEDPAITDVEKQDESQPIPKDTAPKNVMDDQKVVEEAVVDSETPVQKQKGVDNASAREPSNATLQDQNVEHIDNVPGTDGQTKTAIAENDTKARLRKEDADDVNDRRQTPQEAVALMDKKENQNIQNKRLNTTTDASKTGTVLQDTYKKNDEGIAVVVDTPLDEDTLLDEDDDIAVSKKKSIFDEIEAQEEADVAKVAATDGGKWSVGANVAPVYFSSMGEGSPIHSSFVPNSKSGDINLSYGLSVAYAISNKLSIRSGIHKVDYGYDTNDVEFSSSFEASANGQIQNIDYTVTSENVFVSSKTSANALRENVAFDAANQEASRDGFIAQQFGYLEIPVELNYALVDKRFGVNLVGGVSSLFLVDNSVELSSGQLTTEIGKANNINSVNFSANAGFGINYKVSPKVRLNVEPVFKYQLNTFSNTSGNFQPFSIGVYSGLNFRF